MKVVVVFVLIADVVNVIIIIEPTRIPSFDQIESESESSNTDYSWAQRSQDKNP